MRSKQDRQYRVKGVHFGPEDADLWEWVEKQANFSAAVKQLIRKELGLVNPSSSPIDTEAIKSLVERLVNERLAQIQYGQKFSQDPKPELGQEPKQELVCSTENKPKSNPEEPPSDLFSGLW